MSTKRAWAAVALGAVMACSVRAGDEASVRAAAAKLFARPSVTVEQGRSVELYIEGFQYDNYTVRAANDTLGTVTRIRLARDAAGTPVDVLVRGENGRVQAARAVTPLGSANRPLEDLNPFFEPFAAADAEAWGGVMARFYTALTHLDRVLAGADPLPVQNERGAPVKYPMTVEQPRPQLGEPCPDFRGVTMDGRRVSAATFAKRPFLVFAGSLRDAMSREMQRVLYDAVARREGTKEKPLFEVVELYRDRMQHLRDEIQRGGTFRGLALADPDGDTGRLFKLPYLPVLLGYGADHKLKFFAAYRGVAATMRAIDEYEQGLRSAGKQK